jgi:hypothetical protein
MPTLTELQQTFDQLGIGTTRPGFYDEPGFLRAERQDRRFLKKYAQYIEALPFEEQYLLRARRTALEVADYLFDELKRDGRQGACIDISGTATRMLDQEGVWSYMAFGSVIVEFPAQSRLGKKYFRPIVHPDNPAKTGHAWLRVPPFKVLDISLPLQPYPPAAASYLRRYIATEVVAPAPVTTASDLMEDAFVALFIRRNRRRPSMNDLPQVAPGAREFMAEFSAFELTTDGCRVRYVPTGMSAMETPLPGMRNLCLSGKYPAELYREFRDRYRKQSDLLATPETYLRRSSEGFH